MKLEMEGLTAGYGGKRVLDGISLSVKKGEILTLIGPNGCGKSTLLKTVGRILRPQGGCMLLDGKSVHSMNTAELAKQMALLPQTHSAPEDLTVEQLVRYGRFPHRKVFCGLDSHDCEVVENVLGMTRLEGLRKRNLSTLSGGERQRAWIAMTLAQEPEVLLLDEPTTFLDVCCQFEVLELIRMLNRTLNLTILMVLHDLNLAARCSHRLAAVKNARIRYCGPPAEIIRPEVLEDVFEIKAEIIDGPDHIPCFIPVASCKKGGDGK